MKVLYLDHPEADFLAATLYLGLCQELGSENVVDHPIKKSYHGECHSYPSCYDRDFTSPFGSSSGGVGCTGPFDWFPAQPGREYTHAEVCDGISTFDLVVLASPRRNNAAALDDIIATVGRESLPPLVLVDGEDYSDIRVDLIERFQPKIYFKRELLWPIPTQQICRFVPFPFASPIGPQSPKEKEIDVLFVGGGTWPGRAEACAALQAALGSRFVGGTDVRYDHERYVDAISRSKIAVSVRGHGYDTLRFWEIPSCADTLLVADRTPQAKLYPFADGEHALYFSSPQELVTVVQQALSDDQLRTRIARAGNEHLRSHHTARARAQQLLEASL